MDTQTSPPKDANADLKRLEVRVPRATAQQLTDLAGQLGYPTVQAMLGPLLTAVASGSLTMRYAYAGPGTMAE